MVFSKIEIIDGEQYVGINMLENEMLKSKNLKQALNEIKDYCNENIQICKNEQSNDEWECCIEELQGVLKIIDKVLGENDEVTK